MNLVALAEWKKNPIVGVQLRKEYAVQVKAEAEGPVEIIISTAAVDRMGDTIAVEGWKLDNYRKNPVVLFAHDSLSLPVGRSLREWTDGGALRSQVEFTPHEMNPLGASVGAMVRGGFLRAASVGFAPLEWAANEERKSEHWWGPAIDYKRQELLEYSIVPIPANPEALVGAKSAGIDLAPIKAWAERALDLADGAGVRVPRAMLEEAWKASGGKSGVRVFLVGLKDEKASVEPEAAPARKEMDEAAMEAMVARCEAACDKSAAACDKTTVACEAVLAEMGDDKSTSTSLTAGQIAAAVKTAMSEAAKPRQ